MTSNETAQREHPRRSLSADDGITHEYCLLFELASIAQTD